MAYLKECENVVALCFKAFSWHSLGGTEKHHEETQDSLCSRQYSKRASSQFGHGIVQCTTDLEHLYRIYSIPTHDKHQWVLLKFIVLLMMDAKGI